MTFNAVSSMDQKAFQDSIPPIYTDVEAHSRCGPKNTELKMAGTMNMVLAALVAAAAASVLHTTAAERYVVGDQLSWGVPPNTTAYSTWAASHTFFLGDTLVFNFTTGRHDVARVSKEAFDACNKSSPLEFITEGPANYTLNSTGDYHFFCAVGAHCSQGQKFSITVSASSNESPGSPQTPPSENTPSPPPPPSSGSAPSLAAATLSIIFMSIAAGFLG